MAEHKIAKYKLTVVRRDDGREVFTIGYFNDEQELLQWAEDNKGELAKED